MKLELMNRCWSGLLITFCGLDGSGKTTLIKALEEHIFNTTGIIPHIIKQPSDFVRKSEMFRSIIDHKNPENYDYRAMSVFAVSDRLQQSSKLILPLLKRGEIVICDRYYFYALAGINAYGLNNEKWIFDLAQYIPQPDIPFFLDVDYQEAIRRVKSRPIEKDRHIDAEFQKRVQSEFMLMACDVNGFVVPTNDRADISIDIVLKKFDEIYLERNLLSNGV